MFVLCFLNQELPESPSSNGRSTTYDIHMVNLSYVSQVTVMREAAGSPLPSLPSLNLSKVSVFSLLSHVAMITFVTQVAKSHFHIRYFKFVRESWIKVQWSHSN